MNTLLTEDNKYHQLTTTLASIKQFIDTELNAKQVLVVRLQNVIDVLRKELDESHAEAESKARQLQHITQLNEGNKQIINKLLGDISKMQNDLEWYKRTYEKRSFLGVIKQKILKK